MDVWRALKVFASEVYYLSVSAFRMHAFSYIDGNSEHACRKKVYSEEEKNSICSRSHQMPYTDQLTEIGALSVHPFLRYCLV